MVWKGFSFKKLFCTMQSEIMKTRLIISAVGILVCHSYFGLLQEKITRGRYGERINEDGTIGERFTCTLTLVGIECIFNWLFAGGNKKKFILNQFNHFKFY